MEITDTLLKGEHIASSDEDNDRLWSEVSVGFDTHRNFVVELEETGPTGRTYTRAVVDMDNTALLCNRFGTGLLELPAAMRKEFGDDFPNYPPSRMKAVFKDIADFLVETGCKFTVRTYTLPI